jgi:hypothetical protein
VPATLEDLRMVSVGEAARVTGFKSARHFRKLFQADGFRVVPISERKNHVFMVDVASFLARRMNLDEPKTNNV